MEREDREVDHDPQAKYDETQVKVLAMARATENDEQDARLEYCRSLVRLRCHLMTGTSMTGCQQAIAEVAELTDRKERLLESFLIATEAHYHMGEYYHAHECINRVLAWVPRDPTARAWQQLVERRLMADGAQTIAVVSGIICLVTLGVSYLRHKRRAQY